MYTNLMAQPSSFLFQKSGVSQLNRLQYQQANLNINRYGLKLLRLVYLKNLIYFTIKKKWTTSLLFAVRSFFLKDSSRFGQRIKPSIRFIVKKKIKKVKKELGLSEKQIKKVRGKNITTRSHTPTPTYRPITTIGSKVSDLCLLADIKLNTVVNTAWLARTKDRLFRRIVKKHTNLLYYSRTVQARDYLLYEHCLKVDKDMGRKIVNIFTKKNLKKKSKTLRLGTTTHKKPKDFFLLIRSMGNDLRANSRELLYRYLRIIIKYNLYSKALRCELKRKKTSILKRLKRSLFNLSTYSRKKTLRSLISLLNKNKVRIQKSRKEINAKALKKLQSNIRIKTRPRVKKKLSKPRQNKNTRLVRGSLRSALSTCKQTATFLWKRLSTALSLTLFSTPKKRTKAANFSTHKKRIKHPLSLFKYMISFSKNVIMSPYRAPGKLNLRTTPKDKTTEVVKKKTFDQGRLTFILVSRGQRHTKKALYALATKAGKVNVSKTLRFLSKIPVHRDIVNMGVRSATSMRSNSLKVGITGLEEAYNKAMANQRLYKINRRRYGNYKGSNPKLHSKNENKKESNTEDKSVKKVRDNSSSKVFSKNIEKYDSKHYRDSYMRGDSPVESSGTTNLFSKKNTNKTNVWRSDHDTRNYIQRDQSGTQRTQNNSNKHHSERDQGYINRSYQPRGLGYQQGEQGYPKRPYTPRDQGYQQQEQGYPKSPYRTRDHDYPQRPYTQRDQGYQQREQGYTKNRYQPRDQGYQQGERGYSQRPYTPRDQGYQQGERGYSQRPYTPRDQGYQQGGRGYSQRPYTPRDQGYQQGERGYTKNPYQPRDQGYQQREQSYTRWDHSSNNRVYDRGYKDFNDAHNNSRFNTKRTTYVKDITIVDHGDFRDQNIFSKYADRFGGNNNLKKNRYLDQLSTTSNTNYHGGFAGLDNRYSNRKNSSTGFSKTINENARPIKQGGSYHNTKGWENMRQDYKAPVQRHLLRKNIFDSNKSDKVVKRVSFFHGIGKKANKYIEDRLWRMGARVLPYTLPLSELHKYRSKSKIKKLLSLSKVKLNLSKRVLRSNVSDKSAFLLKPVWSRHSSAYTLAWELGDSLVRRLGVFYPNRRIQLRMFKDINIRLSKVYSLLLRRVKKYVLSRKPYFKRIKYLGLGRGTIVRKLMLRRRKYHSGWNKVVRKWGKVLPRWRSLGMYIYNRIVHIKKKKKMRIRNYRSKLIGPLSTDYIGGKNNTSNIMSFSSMLSGRKGWKLKSPTRPSIHSRQGTVGSLRKQNPLENLPDLKLTLNNLKSRSKVTTSRVIASNIKKASYFNDIPVKANQLRTLFIPYVSRLIKRANKLLLGRHKKFTKSSPTELGEAYVSLFKRDSRVAGLRRDLRKLKRTLIQNFRKPKPNYLMKRLKLPRTRSGLVATRKVKTRTLVKRDFRRLFYRNRKIRIQRRFKRLRLSSIIRTYQYRYNTRKVTLTDLRVAQSSGWCIIIFLKTVFKKLNSNVTSEAALAKIRTRRARLPWRRNKVKLAMLVVRL